MVTFNIACAYGFTSNRPERIQAIAAKLTELDPDIVGFQEAFIEKYRLMLFEALAGSRLKYHVIFPSGTVGNGMLIMSAWPIEEAFFHRYEESNPWYKFWEGDWWAGKGVGLARLRLPAGGVIDFYDTHAQAGRAHATGYAEVRTSQMTGLANFVNASRCRTAPAFVVGDFNTRVGRPDFDAAISGAGLLRVMALESAIDHIFAAKDERYTFEVLDTVAIAGEVQGSKASIFLGRAPTPSELKGIVFGPGERTGLSDHSGYMTTLRVKPAV